MRRSGSALIKKGDLILIFTILILAAAFLLFTKFSRQEGGCFVVTIEGREYGRWSLDKDQTINISENGFHNRLQVSRGKVEMTEADCPDKICVHHKPAAYEGETIICLPHKLVVTVEAGGGREKENPVDAISK